MTNEDRGSPRRRRWTNIVVIVASAYSLAAGVWGTGPEAMEQPTDVIREGWLGIAYAIGGFAGFAAIFAARRWPGLARALTALAGLLVLSGFAAMREPTPLAIVSLGAVGIAFLVSAFFMGPMPSPEEEGKHR